MSRPWMPLYVADYIADTGHLSTIEHGAYMLLIMHYWQKGGLPRDDDSLALICRMTARQWAASRAKMAGLFQDGWTHRRIDAELAKAANVSGKRRDAAEQMHAKRAAHAQAHAPAHAPADAQAFADAHADADADANAQAHAEQGGRLCSSTRARASTYTEASEASASAQGCAALQDPSIAERELFRRGKDVLGKDAGGLITSLLRSKGGNVALARACIEQASQAHNPRQFIGAAVTRKMSQGYGKTAYGTTADATSLGGKSVDGKSTNGKSDGKASVQEAAREIAERLRAAERGEPLFPIPGGGRGCPAARLLPEG